MIALRVLGPQVCYHAEVDNKDIDIFSRCVDLAYPDKSKAELWLAQVDMLRSITNLKKLQQKWFACGRSNDARLKNDVKNGCLINFFKTADLVNNKMSQLNEKMAQVQDMSMQPPVNIAAGGLVLEKAMLDSLNDVADLLHNSAKKFIEEMSDITEYKHVGDKFWRSGLALDASVTDITNCAATTIGHINPEGMDGVIQKPHEAGLRLVCWRVRFRI